MEKKCRKTRKSGKISEIASLHSTPKLLGASAFPELRTVQMDYMKSQSFLLWDAATPCDPVRCELRDVCPYVQKGTTIDKCLVETQYLDEVFKELGTLKHQTAVDKHILGLHILPLYRIYVRLKMLAYTIPPEELLDKGKLHPLVMRQMDISEKIVKLLRDEESMSLRKRELETKIKVALMRADGGGGFGDPNYYTAVQEAANIVQEQTMNNDVDSVVDAGVVFDDEIEDSDG